MNNSDVTTSSEQLRRYYLKRTTQTLLHVPRVNNSDVTTSREKFSQYYLKWTTQTVLPQENNSDVTTSNETVAVAQWVRALTLQVEGCVFKSQLWQI